MFARHLSGTRGLLLSGEKGKGAGKSVLLRLLSSFAPSVTEVVQVTSPALSSSSSSSSSSSISGGLQYTFLRAPREAQGPLSHVDVDVLSKEAGKVGVNLNPISVSAFTGRRVHGHSGSGGGKIALLREPFTPSSASSYTEATPLEKIFVKVEGDAILLDPAYVRGEKLQVADIYDVETGEITSVHNTELKELLESLGFCLSFQGEVGKLHTQSSNEVLMVAPTAFEFNESCAEDNHFMSQVSQEEGKEGARSIVLQEYSGLYDMLTKQVGVKVHLFRHNESHGTPDACFPNNWFSTHSELGHRTLVTYPLKSPNRRLERRPDILDYIQTVKNYDRVINFEEYEKDSKFFEGTGCLVLDRANKIAYTALSERCHLDVAEKWCEEMEYNKLVPFHSVDEQNHPVYHTNVLMAVGTSVAVVCTDCVTISKERNALVDSLAKTHEIVSISYDQMSQFCGNVLEVVDRRGLPAMVMSTAAYNGFTRDQRKVLRSHFAGGIHHAPIDTLEHIGGGGVRCTLAEVF